MTVASLLLFGLLLGVRHALEADHVAAVAVLTRRAHSLKDHIRLASAWGVGHASVVVIFGAVVFALGVALPEPVVRGLEGIVGVVLIALGVDVLRRARRGRVHFHLHEHQDGAVHVHAHAHDPAGGHHGATPHEHDHPRGVLLRSLLVGSAHGLTGSAALVLIPLQRSDSAIQAMAYLVAFGLGSILGMVLFSVGISVPRRLAARGLGPGLRAVEGVLAAFTVAFGCWITAGALFGTVAG